MPIIDENKQTTVKFGIGDIYINNFRFKNSKYHTGVLLAQTEVGEIGTYGETKREHTKGLEPNSIIEKYKERCIRLEFNSLKSIKQLISVLKGVELDLIQQDKALEGGSDKGNQQ